MPLGHGLADSDLPGLFDAADRASLRGQKRYLTGTRARLILAVGAASLSAFSFHASEDLDLLSLFAALAFVGALTVEIWLLSEKPEQTWYDGRALAESAKTLAWRYSVGAEPFPISLTDSEAAFITELKKLLTDAPRTGIIPSALPPVSDVMARLRSSSLASRRSMYLRDRIANQRDWYAQRSALNQQLSDRWKSVLLATEVIAIALSLGRGVGWLDVDLAGIAAAVIGSAVAWIEVKQFRGLSRAYTFANLELAMIHQELSSIGDEDAWASASADAEEAISREHTMWRASRSTLGP